MDDRDGEAFETLYALGQGLYDDGDRRGDITGDGEISEKDSLEFYTWYDPGPHHKSAGMLSSCVPKGQDSGGSWQIDNRFGRCEVAGYLSDPVLGVHHVRPRPRAPFTLHPYHPPLSRRSF